MTAGKGDLDARRQLAYATPHEAIGTANRGHFQRRVLSVVDADYEPATSTRHPSRLDATLVRLRL